MSRRWPWLMSAGPLVNEVVERFWAAMQRNDWAAAADCFVPEITIDWPCSGERIVGRANFVALQERYPTTTGQLEVRHPPAGQRGPHHGQRGDGDGRGAVGPGRSRSPTSPRG